MDPQTGIADEEIARKVQEGDHDAFGVLMSRYEPKLMRYALRLLGERDAAEEVVQETFIHAYRNINGFNPNLHFSPWVYRIAHNQAMDELRRTKRAPLAVDLDTFITLSSDDDTSAEAERGMVQRTLDEHLQQLPAAYREILVLFYFEDMDYRAISDTLRIPVSTAGVRLRRARAALKKIMNAHHE